MEGRADTKDREREKDQRPGATALDFEKPLLELERRVSELKAFSAEKGMDLSEEVRTLELKAERLKKEIFANLTAWQRVLIARHPRRPYALDYIERIFDDFIELKGDRFYGNDNAIVAGLGLLGGTPVTVIGQQKGRDTKENIARNFGMPSPEGYRKALRLMKQAAKFHRPVVTLIDTPGAFPGLEAEKRGQAEAIARNLLEMSRLATPIVAVVIGEGGSGGALAIGVADRVLMLENSVYATISPEGCAAILWRDASMNREAAEALKITAGDLLALGVIDGIIPEPLGGAHTDWDAAARNLKTAVLTELGDLTGLETGELLKRRYARFRAHGVFAEAREPGDLQQGVEQKT